MSVPESKMDSLLKELDAAGVVDARVIGEVAEDSKSPIRIEVAP